MKRIFKILLASLLVFLGLVSCLPTLLSITSIGRPILTRLLIQSIDGKACTYSSLKMGWLTSCSVNDLQLSSTDGKTTIAIEKIETDQGLFFFLLHPHRLGEIHITSPKVVHTIQETFSKVKPLNADLSQGKASALEMPLVADETVPGAYNGRFIIQHSTCELRDGHNQLIFSLHRNLPARP